jgi:hypothetical protein
MQYAAIAKILLNLLTPPGHLVTETVITQSASDDEVQQLAALVCGLAYTNENLAATLNAFGPLIFCMFTTPFSYISVQFSLLTRPVPQVADICPRRNIELRWSLCSPS